MSICQGLTGYVSRFCPRTPKKLLQRVSLPAFATSKALVRRVEVHKTKSELLNRDAPLKDDASNGHIGPEEAESSILSDNGSGSPEIMREFSGSLTAKEPEGGDSAGHSTSSDSQIDPHKIGIKQVDKFMQLMRLIPQGLVLVLANQPSRNMRTDSLPWLGNKGMLASSFNSVTIEPEPFVSFNVKVPSGTFEEIKETGSFTVLAVNNAFLADAFTGKSEDSDIVLGRMKRSTPAGLARQGFIWWMQCELMPDKSVTVGDHVIVVGRVACLEEFPGMSGEQALLYSNGSYRLPGARIKPENDARMYAHYAGRRKTRSKIIRLRSVKMKGGLAKGTNTNKDLQVKRWRRRSSYNTRVQAKLKKPEEPLVNEGKPLAPNMSSAPQEGSACKN